MVVIIAWRTILIIWLLSAVLIVIRSTALLVTRIIELLLLVWRTRLWRATETIAAMTSTLRSAKFGASLLEIGTTILLIVVLTSLVSAIIIRVLLVWCKSATAASIELVKVLSLITELISILVLLLEIGTLIPVIELVETAAAVRTIVVIVATTSVCAVIRAVRTLFHAK